jgi:sugar O-acyltransferase (sialic acid O-acetyltransferase NeuD family)
MPDIIIVGGGGFGLEVITYLADLMANDPDLRIRGVIDDGIPRLADFPVKLPHLGGIDGYRAQEGDSLLIAVGDAAARWAVAKRLEGARFYTLVHPTAYVAPSATLQPGAIVCPLAFVGPLARIGAHAALNVQSSLGHDARLGAGSVLSPGTKVNGGATVGEACFLGTLATVSPGATIGAFSKVAAGSVFSGEAEAGSLIAGSPARSRVMFRPPQA